jgi:UPF0716 protein FxsA
MPLLFLLFIGVPLIEVGLFVVVGQEIGALATVALVVLTAIIGTVLVRLQGIATLASAQRQMARGEPPVGPLFDGLCLLVGAVLLLTPGFLTDTIGFLLLLPASRTVLGRRLWQVMQRRQGPGGQPFGHPFSGPFGGAGRTPPERDPVIESEYRDLDREREDLDKR